MFIEKYLTQIVAGLLLIGVIFASGYGCCYKRMSDKVALLKVTKKAALSAADMLNEQNERLLAEIKKQNDELEKVKIATEARIRAVEAERDRVVSSLLSSHRRALAAVSQELSDFKARMAELPPAVACHEAWLEVAR